MQKLEEPLRAMYDVIVFDTSPGNSQDVNSTARASDIATVVCNPTMASIAGALQCLRRIGTKNLFAAVLNMVKNEPYEISGWEVRRKLGWLNLYEAGGGRIGPGKHCQL